MTSTEIVGGEDRVLKNTTTIPVQELNSGESTQKLAEENSTCYTVQMKKGSLTYCNITSMWKPVVKKPNALAAGFSIAFITLFFIAYGFCKAGSTLRGLCCACQSNAGCFTLCNFVLAAVLRILWKVIDVAIDTMTYYRLGKVTTI